MREPTLNDQETHLMGLALALTNGVRTLNERTPEPSWQVLSAVYANGASQLVVQLKCFNDGREYECLIQLKK